MSTLLVPIRFRLCVELPFTDRTYLTGPAVKNEQLLAVGGGSWCLGGAVAVILLNGGLLCSVLKLLVMDMFWTGVVVSGWQVLLSSPVLGGLVLGALKPGFSTDFGWVGANSGVISAVP